MLLSRFFPSVFLGDALFRFSVLRCQKSRLGEIDHGLIARNTKRGDAMRHLLLNYILSKK